MRRPAAVLVVTGIAFACAAPAFGGSPFVGITATEFDLQLSRQKVNPGRGEIQLVNEGEDPHDLVIKRVGSDVRRQIPEIPSGGDPETLELRFKRGSRYIMWCSTLGGQHRQQGMEADLRVRN